MAHPPASGLRDGPEPETAAATASACRLKPGTTPNEQRLTSRASRGVGGSEALETIGCTLRNAAATARMLPRIEEPADAVNIPGKRVRTSPRRILAEVCRDGVRRDRLS